MTAKKRNKDSTKDLTAVQRLVGKVTEKELCYIDSFVSKNISLFMPMGGQCGYATAPGHSHPSYMFTISFNNEMAIKMGNKILTSKCKKLFALSPGIVHQELPSDTPPRYIAIFIAKKFFEKHLAKYPGKTVFNGNSFDTPEGLLPLLKKFMTEARSLAFGRDAVLEALGTEICHSIIRGALGVTIDQSASARVDLDSAVEYIQARMGEKITVDILAAVSGISESNFSRTFKKEFKVTPAEYLIRARLDRAKRFILAGDKSLTAIALECGFNSSSYLSSCFKKKFKLSPSEYLRDQKKSGISK